MNLLGILLVGASCLTHSAWNLIAKPASGKLDFFWWVTLGVAVGLALPCGAALAFFPLPAKAWLCAAGSGAFLAIYCVALSLAYRGGDLSIIYPLARSAPLFILAFTEIFLGVRHSASGFAGLGLIVAGAVVLPLGAGGDRRRWFNRANLWALLTALATSGYSLCDHAAMGAIHDLRPGAAGLAVRAFGYLWVQFSCGWLALTALLVGTFHPPTRETWRAHGGRAAAVAGLTAFTYSLILLAMMTNEVTYVVAFRQFSIVLGVGMGIWILGEREGAATRVAGAVLITAGLLLVAFAR